MRGRNLNHNVWLCLLMWALYSLADSIWNGTVFVSFLYIMADDSNADVGYIEAMQGAAMLLTALPVGYLADKGSKATVTAYGGAFNLVAISILAFSVINPFEYSANVNFWILCVAMCVYGLVSGVVNGPAQALFADSIATGDRSRWYLYLYVAGILASVVGPIISIFGFLLWGNVWTLPELRKIILVGLAVHIPTSISMFYFNDEHALGEESEALNSSKKDDLKEQDSLRVTRTYFGFTVTEAWIPYLLFIGDIISSLASGMTIKFFPLWFKNELHMDPIPVQLVFALSPLFIALFSWGSQKATLNLGRVWVVIAVSLVGVACLLLMVYVVDKVPLWTTVVIYLVRTAAMNCTYPIQEAILMDYVPKSRRSRWKSLQSVASFGWCGSAAVGGILADQYGYGSTFVLTAILQGAASLVWLPMLGIVAEEKLVYQEIVSEENKPLVNWHVEDNPSARRLSYTHATDVTSTV